MAPQGISVKHQDLRKDLLVVDPLPSDVMLGRGRAFLRHPGNMRLNTVVRMNMQRYLNAGSRNEKTWITEEIVEIIQTYGNPPGRFLRYKPKAGGWYEVDDEEARVKVSHTVRYRRRCMEKHEISESTDSSLSLSGGDQPDTVAEEAMPPVCDAPQPERIPSGVSNSTTSTLLFNATMLADLECDATIFPDLGSDIICVTPENSHDFEQRGVFLL
jgi:hypothetical protein